MFSLLQMSQDYLRHRPGQARRRPEVATEERNVKGKITIVTGSNSGLGKQTALELAKRGAIIVMACRDLTRAEEAKQDILVQVPQGQLEILALDLGDLDSVRKFADNFKKKYTHLDLLINNGGSSTDGDLKTKDGFEMNMGVNHLGHFLLTHLLLGHLQKAKEGSRIVCVSSSMIYMARLNLDDLMMTRQSKGFMNYTPYSNSKLANALFVKELARRLNGRGNITCYALCPGIVGSNFFTNDVWYKKFSANVSQALLGFNVEQGAETIVYCALSSKLNTESGQFYRFLNRWEGIQSKLDPKMAQDLWDKSENLVGLSPSFLDTQLNAH